MVVLALAWIFASNRHIAQAFDPSPWRQNLSCDPASQKFQGIEYCTAEDGKIHVLIIDRQSPGVRLEYVIAEGQTREGFGECRDVNVPAWGPVRGGCADLDNSNWYPVMSLADAMHRFPRAAAIFNSDYGAGTQGKPGEFRGHGPEGLTVVRGDRLDGPANSDFDAPGNDPNTNNAVRRPWLAVSEQSSLRAELNQFARGEDDGGKPDWIYTAVGGAPWLIRDGEIQDEEIRTCKNAPNSCYQGAAQTAVGISDNERWLFLVADARKGQTRLRDLAQFMDQKLGAKNAIKFDGGGSTQFAYANEAIVKGDGRSLSQYLAVIAPSGHGIDDTDERGILRASPTSALVYDIALPGETAELHVGMRNEGATTWTSSDSELVQISGNLPGAPASMSVQGEAPPGNTVTWIIRAPVSGIPALRSVRYQMHYNGQPFGDVVTAYVIVLPERLKEMEQRLRDQIDEWQRQGEQAAEDFMQRIWAEIQKEIEKQATNFFQNLISQCFGPTAMLGLAMAFVYRRSSRSR